MKKVILLATFSFLLVFLIPAVPTEAQDMGLIPCSGVVGDECQFCSVVQLTHNVIEWLTNVLGIIAVLIIIYAGVRLTISAGAVEAKMTARKLLASAVIGYILFLSAAILVDTFIKFMIDQQNYGLWDNVECVPQPRAQQSSRPTASGDNQRVLSDSEIDSRVAAIAASGEVQEQITAAAEQAGLSPEEEKLFRALISQESSNCVNKVGPTTRFGTAYGCGQMLLGTAKSLDPTATVERLRDDDAFNLALSAQYFKQEVNQYNGDTRKALAAYNGGGSAVLPSVDCPGLQRWECPWDSPGCYGTNKTDCKRNEGPNSYQQTRHYVENITNLASEL